MRIYQETIINSIAIFMLTAFLVLLILPAFNSYESAEERREVHCASNLKQIGLGLLMYCNDHGGFYPDKSGAAGLEQLRSLDYITDYKIFVCPSTKIVPGGDEKPLTEANVSYCFRGGMSKKDSADSVICHDKPNNHKKFGNVLYIDGHVSGIAGANWMEKVR